MKRYFVNQDGLAVVEFAFIAPIMLVMLLGIYDFGRYINTQMNLENAARASAEYVLHGGSEADIENNVVLTGWFDANDGITLSYNQSCECASGVVVSCSGTCDADNDYVREYFEVDLAMNYSTSVPYTGAGTDLALRGHARLQVANSSSEDDIDDGDGDGDGDGDDGDGDDGDDDHEDDDHDDDDHDDDDHDDDDHEDDDHEDDDHEDDDAE